MEGAQWSSRIYRKFTVISLFIVLLYNVNPGYLLGEDRLGIDNISLLAPFPAIMYIWAELVLYSPIHLQTTRV